MTREFQRDEEDQRTINKFPPHPKTENRKLTAEHLFLLFNFYNQEEEEEQNFISSA